MKQHKTEFWPELEPPIFSLGPSVANMYENGNKPLCDSVQNELIS
jgi:hypothetical protein